MRYACRIGYHKRCPGRWCTCSCHRDTEGEEQRPTSRQEARTVADQQGTPTPAGTC